MPLFSLVCDLSKGDSCAEPWKPPITLKMLQTLLNLLRNVYVCIRARSGSASHFKKCNLACKPALSHSCITMTHTITSLAHMFMCRYPTEAPVTLHSPTSQ